MNTRYGNLIIPARASLFNFEDSEFGTAHTVKKSTYFYSTVPSQALITGSKKSLVPIAGKKSFPTVLTDGKESVGVQAELRAKQEVLARAVPGYPGILEVVLFENSGDVIEDMDETGDGITISSKGYVLAKDLQAAAKPAHFKAIHQPIFKNQNLIDDVKQYTFGDCFLLASILAILSKEGGSDYIRSMMVQDGDHTIVRLYDPNTMQPLYVRVNNSVYHEDGKNVIKHKALWVHILEKAYVAAGYKKDKSDPRGASKEYKAKFEVSYPAFREIYGNGGGPSTAMTVLTGQPAERNNLKAIQGYTWNTDWMLCMSVYKEVKPFIEKFSGVDTDLLVKLDRFLKQNKNHAFFAGLIKKLHSQCDEPLAVRIKDFQDILKTKNLSADDAAIFESIFSKLQKDDDGESFQTLNAFVSYLSRYNEIFVHGDELISDVFSNVRQMAEAGEYVCTLFANDKFEEFMQLEKSGATFHDAISYWDSVTRFKPTPPAATINSYLLFVNASKDRWSFPAGTAIYTPEAEKLFANLKNAFEQHNQMFVASTKAKLPGDKFPGLRPQHAYAVTGIVEEQGAYGEVHKFLKVRNPWGHTGSHFQSNGKGEVSVTEVVDLPEFKVELSHFAEYFNAVSGGSFVKAPKVTNEQQNTLQQRHAVTEAALTKKNFFERHWKKMLVGAVVGMLVATAVAAGVLSFGAVPLAFLGAHAIIAAVVFLKPIVAAALGAGVGALTGLAVDHSKKKGANSASIYKAFNATPSLSPANAKNSNSNVAKVTDESFGEDPIHHPYLKTALPSAIPYSPPYSPPRSRPSMK